MTRTRFLHAGAAALAVLLVLSASMARAESYQIDAVATDGGDRYWFEFQEYAGRNPTLSFAAGDQVTVRITNGGTQPHNIHFGTPVARGSEYLMPGTNETFTFTVPGGIEAQQIEYWCDPHRQFGMRGPVVLAASFGAPGQESVETPQQDAPAPALALVAAAALLAATLARRRTR